MLTEFFSLMILFFAALLCFLPMKSQLRYSALKTAGIVIPVLIIVTVSLSWVISRFGLNENQIMIPVFALFFVFYHCLLRVHISKSLSVFCSIVAMFSILSNLEKCLCLLLIPDTSPFLHELLSFGIGATVSLLLAFPFKKYGSFTIDRLDIPRFWFATMVFSICIFVLNMFLLQVYGTAKIKEESLLYFILAFVTLLLIDMMMFAVFFFAVVGLLQKNRVETRVKMLEMRESMFDSQQRYFKASEKTRHDFRQSLRLMLELYDTGNYDELGKYLHQYTQTVPNSEIYSYTENVALNALLNYYRHVCNLNNIRFTAQIAFQFIHQISDVDLCTIMGNILENAVIACQKTEDRFIDLNMVTEEDLWLYIIETNSFDGKVRKKNGNYLSTNRNGNAFGLASISSTVESYGGVAQFYHEDTRFYTNIAIPLNKTTESKEQVL